MDENNITIRRKYRCGSLESIKTLESDISFESSTSNKLGRSLPDLSTMDQQEINDLKSTIENLQTQLLSAHNEIDTLTIKNISLEKQITDYELQISKLMNICSSSWKKRKNSHKNHNLKMNKLIFCDTNTLNSTSNTDNTLENKRISSDVNIPKHIFSDLPSTSNISHGSVKMLPSSLNQICNKMKSITNITNKVDKRKILIFGGQQCVNLATSLIKSRSNSNYEKYAVNSLVKPYASSEEIINGLDVTDIGERDKVIISLGESDNNPNDTKYSLLKTLKTLCNRSVIVLAAKHNPYLNEQMLNKELELICKQFPKCSFLNIYDNCLYYGFRYLCRKINFIVDCLDYNCKFLNFKNHFNCYNKKVSYYKKGTIPYYFNIMSKMPKTAQVQKQLDIEYSLNRTTLPKSSVNNYKKGTLPYYFNIVSRTIKTTHADNEVIEKNIGEKVPKQFFRETPFM